MPETRSSASQTKTSSPDAEMTMDISEFSLNMLESLKDEAIRREMKSVFQEALQTSGMLDTLRQEMKKMIDPLTDRINKQDEKIQKLEEKNAELENTLDKMEQYSRRESVRIMGLPEGQDDKLEEQIINIINEDLKVETPITPSDIARLHRVGTKKPSLPRPVILKFASYRVRSAVMRNKQNLKQRSGPKLFFNEDLTQKRAKLLKDARDLKKKGKINDVWTKDGRIVLKRNDAVIKQVSTSQQLTDAVK